LKEPKGQNSFSSWCSATKLSVSRLLLAFTLNVSYDINMNNEKYVLTEVSQKKLKYPLITLP